jgi:hypothetical protein
MSANNNNTAETIARGSAFQESVREEDNYPDPSTLPLPSQEQRLTDITLSEITPGKYVVINARVVYLRAIERQDALGSKMILN